MKALTVKQIRLLQLLSEKEVVIADWHHSDLSVLLNYKFVVSGHAYAASGRLSRNKMWSITDRGREFLRVERGVL